MLRMLPRLGTPAVEKLRRIWIVKNDTSRGASRGNPNTCARKRTWATLETPRLSVNAVTDSGSTRPVAEGGNARCLWPPRTRAGSEAIEDRVLTATSWAGATARANRAIDTRPRIAVTG